MKRLKILGLALAASLSVAAVEAQQGGWTFQGCWTQFSSGPCYDVYTDSSGNYWRCARCGTTNKPSTKNCIRITPSTGLWCS
jgi:hypothetical protein